MRQGDRIDLDGALQCLNLDRTVKDDSRRTIFGIGEVERAGHRCEQAGQRDQAANSGPFVEHQNDQQRADVHLEIGRQVPGVEKALWRRESD